MGAADVMEVTRAALTVLMTVAGPLLVAALVTGTVIGLLQALTQVQEMTLTFVPKLLVMAGVLLVGLPAMGAAMGRFMALIAERIVHG